MDDRGNSLDEYENESSGGSGLYVDIENLHSSSQPVIRNLVENWPDKAPAPSRLTLYVRADQVELWRLWAASRFSDLKVVVKGTQHFSMTSTKNSADIAIATNAMADLILGRVAYVAVISDDSDFISLYAAIRDEPEIPLLDGKVPFLWIVTSLSNAKRYVPVEGEIARNYRPLRQVIDHPGRRIGDHCCRSDRRSSNGVQGGVESGDSRSGASLAVRHQPAADSDRYGAVASDSAQVHRGGRGGGAGPGRSCSE